MAEKKDPISIGIGALVTVSVLVAFIAFLALTIEHHPMDKLEKRLEIKKSDMDKGGFSDSRNYGDVKETIEKIRKIKKDFSCIEENLKNQY